MHCNPVRLLRFSAGPAGLKYRLIRNPGLYFYKHRGRCAPQQNSAGPAGSIGIADLCVAPSRRTLSGFCSKFVVGCLAVIVGARGASAEGGDLKAPAPNSPEEPMAQQVSLEKAAEFLDATALGWTRQRKCGSCHTNYVYLFARPALKGIASPAATEVRGFFEDRVTHWETAKPRWDTEVVATAVALAVNDAATTGKLHPLSRKALDLMWPLQKEDGSWDWLKCGWPPMEHDDYFGVVYAAIGVGAAPDGYAATESAKAGIAKLREHLRAHPAPSLHHKAMLLWASSKLDGLLTPEEAQKTVEQLRALQKPDGGWSLASLGDWKRHDGNANDAAQADAYATSFLAVVLRAAGAPADDPALRKARDWLRGHQRASGRWFTRSPSADNYHFLTHAATAYAVMALAEESGAAPAGSAERR